MIVSEIRQACERLLHDYAWTQDNGETEAFAELFAPDAVWVRPGREPLIGRQAILDNAVATFIKTPQEKLMHCISNVRLNLDDEGAASTCYSIALQGDDGGAGFCPESLPVAGMIYRNRFKAVDGVWRICRHQTEFRFRK